MTSVVSFILVLGFLIFIHELGHYLAARHVGVKVETFSIGFPPKMWGKKVGDTDYIISWVPLGGYVKLFGQNMDDEDHDDPTNYASKTVAQRFYILVAGPAMNLLFAFLFMPLVYLVGVNAPKYLQDPAIISSVQAGGFAEQVGFQAEDEIVAVNGTSVHNWEGVHAQVGKTEASYIEFEVERSGYSKTLTGTVEELKNQGAGWVEKIAPVVGGFSDTSPAKAAGLQVGDYILSIEGMPVKEWKNISELVQKTQAPVNTVPSEDTTNAATPPSVPTVPISIEVKREGQIHVVEVTPYFDSTRKAYLLGMGIESIKRSYGLAESVEKGTERLVSMTAVTFQFLGRMLTGKGSLDDLGGPLRIGVVVGEAAKTGVGQLLFLMSIISLQLGIFNLFPIPALDGGHIFFLILEKLKGGPLSIGLRERTQIIGFSLLLFLMVVVTWNDIVQLWL